jgi:hypothetical protein
MGHVPVPRLLRAGWLPDAEIHQRHRPARIMETGIRSTSDLVELLCGMMFFFFFFMYVCRGMGCVVWSHASSGAVCQWASPSLDLMIA